MGDHEQPSNCDIFKLLQTAAQESKDIKETPNTIQNSLKQLNEGVAKQNTLVKNLTDWICDLEKENHTLTNKLNNIGRSAKKNNIILFGILKKMTRWSWNV